ncbi:MAG: hypothetical protein HY075_13965 [Deltaproteobacteria bacterium]|nr:hypothetical protein [Deltaproteobacteria bacterium]
MKSSTSIFIFFATLSLFAHVARAGDDKELCAPLIHLAKKEYAAEKTSGTRRYNDAPIYQMRMAAELFTKRLTAEHKLLIRAAREKKLGSIRLSSELIADVVRPSVEDLDSLPDGRWSWRSSHFRLNAEVAYGDSVELVSCSYDIGQCIFVDLLKTSDYSAEIEKQAAQLAGLPPGTESDFVRTQVPAACFADVGAPKVDEQEKTKTVPEHYPMDEKLPTLKAASKKVE